MLGLVYDKNGEKEKAKGQFEELLLLNPQNQHIKDIMDNISKGLPALEGISSSQLPVEESSAIQD